MNKHSQYSVQRGFTLVELLVTIGIFIFMTSIVLAKYRSFNTNSDFANAVEGIVLSLREAQVYGVGSKTAGVVTCGSPASTFNCAYGIYMSKANYENGAYLIFIDADENGLYNFGTDPIVKMIDLWGPSKIWISDIKVNGIAANTLAVTFKRPNPDAKINGVPGNTQASITISKVTDGGNINSNTINIISTGQLWIQ